MLALIKHLPDESAFKTAVDWPLPGHLSAAMVNSINALRSEMFPGTPYKPILPPSAEREQNAKRAQVRAAHDDLMNQMRGKR